MERIVAARLAFKTVADTKVALAQRSPLIDEEAEAVKAEEEEEAEEEAEDED